MTTTPSTAVYAIADATSSCRAPTTGARAAMAELPQMAFPHATSNACTGDNPSARPIATPVTIAAATTPTIDATRGNPALMNCWRSAPNPSRTIDTSRSNPAANTIPGLKRSGGDQNARTTAPIRIARTIASSVGWPTAIVSSRSAIHARADTAMTSERPGSRRATAETIANDTGRTPDSGTPFTRTFDAPASHRSTRFARRRLVARRPLAARCPRHADRARGYERRPQEDGRTRAVARRAWLGHQAHRREPGPRPGGGPRG